MNKIQLEDFRRIGDAEFIDWERFRDTTILVTGATGLIGSNLVYALAYNSREKDLNMKLILPVQFLKVQKTSTRRAAIRRVIIRKAITVPK